MGRFEHHLVAVQPGLLNSLLQAEALLLRASQLHSSLLDEGGIAVNLDNRGL